MTDNKIKDITEFYYYKIKGSGGTTYIPRGAKFSKEELDMIGVPSNKENVWDSVSNNFYFEYPKRRDGKPDMRYGICKLHRLLKIIKNYLTFTYMKKLTKKD